MASKITFDRQTYTNRRKRFMELVGSGKYLFIGNDDVGANYRDNIYPFRQDSTFLYYFGINQPNLCVLIDADNDKTILFGDDITIEYVIWMGKLPSLIELAGKVGITEVLPYASMENYIKGNTNYLPPYRGDHYLLLQSFLKLTPAEIDQNVSVKMIMAVVNQRSIKEDQEIIELEKAVSATAQMHAHIIRNARQGMKEYELVGMASQKAWEMGCLWSFNPILTINGQTLHNHHYGNELKEGNILLYDGGCQLESLYAGDMTRSMPVAKRFEKKQEEIYSIVLDALNQCVDLLKPGVLYKDVHLTAAKVIFDGLKELGITKGDTDEAVKAGAHSVFFPHGLGHMMGLDVHDMENLDEKYVGYTEGLERSAQFGLKSLRLGRKLEEGFVITVEPGIYFIPELIDLRSSQGEFMEYINYEKLEYYKSFGGIRIEDDYVITNDNARLLGDPLAKNLKDIYELRDQAF